MTFVAVLALAQGVLAVLRSLHWFDIGSDLMERGILLLPAIAMFVYARGALVGLIALLYVLFAFGEFAGRGWTRSCGARRIRRRRKGAAGRALAALSPPFSTCCWSWARFWREKTSCARRLDRPLVRFVRLRRIRRARLDALLRRCRRRSQLVAGRGRGFGGRRRPARVAVGGGAGDRP